MEKLIENLKATANQWPGTNVYYREDWQCEYFTVADKGFCMLGHNKEHEKVMTIKGLPEKNEELREQYSFVVPGYYANKTHWNSIILEKSTFIQEELVVQLKQSYELVVNKLPKKIQAIL